MTRTFRSLRLALAALVVALVACLGLPATEFLGAIPVGAELADANTYNVYACNDSGGPNHSWSQWWNSGVSTITSGQGCPNGGYDGNTNKGVFARYIAGSWDPNGAAGGWQFNAPAGNNIASITLSDWFSRANNGQYAILLGDWGPIGDGCRENGSTLCGLVQGPHTLAVNGSGSVRTEVGCHNISGCQDNGYGTSGLFAIYGATVTVNDLTNPTSTPSGSLWTGSWQRGVRTISVAGADSGDGIQRNDVKVDGQTVLSQSHGCDYSYARPCSNQTDSFSYETKTLGDGAHSIQVLSYDAAWLGASSSGTIYTDNTAPTKPTSPALAGAAGWRSSNGFSIGWTDPSQGGASPIAAVHYSLCSASNSTSCPVTDQRVAGSGVNSLSSVNVPGAGDWVLRTWVEDAAGNADPSATSDPIHLMYDPIAPGMAAPQHNNGWFNAANIENKPEPINLDEGVSPPLSGIAGYAVSLDGSNPGTTIDVRATSPDGTATYPIADLPEGKDLIKARAISGAGVPSTQVGSAEIDVDKTPPTTDLSGAPDPDRWQNHPVTLTVKGSDQPELSGMGASPDATVQHGAYISYRVDGGQAQLLPGDTAQVPLTGDGDHTVRYQAYDFAGNPSTEKSLRVKVDTTAPSPVVFEAPIPGDPRRLIVAAADKASGVASGVIELRKQGSNDPWRTLPTARLSESEFTTYVDDTKLDPAAKYEFRARVDDAAGNEGVGSTYADGSAVVLPGQLRTATHVAVGFGKPASNCEAPAKHRKAKHHGAHKKAARKAKPCPTKKHEKRKHRSKAKRAQVALQEAIASARNAARQHKRKHHTKKKSSAPTPPGQEVVPFGRSAIVSGALTTVEGAPIANQAVAVFATLRSPGSEARLVGHVRTDAHGAFRYVAPAGASRTLDFRFEGTDALYPSDQPVKLLVPASTTLKRSKRIVRNGHSVTFRGRLRGTPLPTAGKLVNLQVFYRRRWRTFATPRTNAEGGWRFSYRFEVTHGAVTYKFRAAVKREAAYPYELGYSKLARVTVRG